MPRPPLLVFRFVATLRLLTFERTVLSKWALLPYLESPTCAEITPVTEGSPHGGGWQHGHSSQ